MASRLLRGNRVDSVVFREMETQVEKQDHGEEDTFNMKRVGFGRPLGYNRQCAN